MNTTTPPNTVSSPAPGLRRYLLVCAAAIALATLATVLYLPGIYAVRTDDAYLQADSVSIVPKVAAYVTAIHVDDNTAFAAGQLLVELDQHEFLADLATARADLANAVAAKKTAAAQLEEQTHAMTAASATLDGDRAALTFARQQQTRYERLAQDGAGTGERSQQASLEIAQKNATLAHDQAQLTGAKSHLEVLKSQLEQAEAAIIRQQAAVAQAELNLSYTRIYAPAAGTVANKSVQTGNFVQAGQTLFAAVPDKLYAIANLKETQLAHIARGQTVKIKVDAYPDLTLQGHVDSLQRGTGSNFALLPPENATGNFIKVVQRIPVKIVLDQPKAAIKTLAPGMSITPSIMIQTPPRWLAALLD